MPQLQSVSVAKLPTAATFVCDARRETVVASLESRELEPEVEQEGSEVQPGDDFLEIEIGKMEASDPSDDADGGLEDEKGVVGNKHIGVEPLVHGVQ